VTVHSTLKTIRKFVLTVRKSWNRKKIAPLCNANFPPGLILEIVFTTQLGCPRMIFVIFILLVFICKYEKNENRFFKLRNFFGKTIFVFIQFLSLLFFKLFVFFHVNFPEGHQRPHLAQHLFYCNRLLAVGTLMSDVFDIIDTKWEKTT